eukprot:12165737-Alexandrium_andersonii.AAC.1
MFGQVLGPRSQASRASSNFACSRRGILREVLTWSRAPAVKELSRDNLFGLSAPMAEDCAAEEAEGASHASGQGGLVRPGLH